MDSVHSFSQSQIETAAGFKAGIGIDIDTLKLPVSCGMKVEAGLTLTSNVKLAKQSKPRKKQKAGAPKHLWTSEEDDILEQAVKTLGEKSWSAIAARLPGRVGKQCRDRWRNHLCPEVKKGSWTKEEDRLLFEHQNILGNQWAEIAKHVPGRTDLSVKNRYYSYLRKVGRQKARREKEKETNLDNKTQTDNVNVHKFTRQLPATAPKSTGSTKLHSLRVDTSPLHINTTSTMNTKIVTTVNQSGVNENSRKRQRMENKENTPLSSKHTITPHATQTPMPKNNTFSAAGFPAVSPEQSAFTNRFRNDGKLSLGVLPRQLLDMASKTDNNANDHETTTVNATSVFNKPNKTLPTSKGLDNESLIQALGIATSQNLRLMSSLWNMSVGGSLDLLSNSGPPDTTNLVENVYTSDFELGATTQNTELLSLPKFSSLGSLPKFSNLGSLPKCSLNLANTSLDIAMLNQGGNFSDIGSLGSLAQLSSLARKDYPLNNLNNLPSLSELPKNFQSI
eukprot:CAMPEP_0204832380 /NCGR_PEP_ID=MMETSP1346-20131115/13490_1 /ASSEMBLY_ACC=CAM_ASM_000771 /TAXON_ID=215587 /ORGANISM="Aplanochytrium stocchinoi, Strain GSBS06" /LENGTH=506 /DNA_ID=CAMNT_0051964153 /DNA_START=68 /DNA_END=1588 /DNA_ORIENTATION=+